MPGNVSLGNADVPVGPRDAAGCTSGNADVLVGIEPGAGEDAGAPRKVGTPEDAGHPRGWYSRGYLPHCDAPVLQAITYRLGDSLPRETLRQLDESLRGLPEQNRTATRRARIDAWLDAGMGCCALRHPDVASYVQMSLLHFHGDRYHLHAWCVMPNHVHVLIQPMGDIASIVQGWKSFTARWILRNRVALGLRIPDGQSVWMRDYWDRYIRDESHYQRVVDYIHQNPVKAGLCRSPAEWSWSSAGQTSGSAPANADVPVGNGPAAGEDAGAPGKATAPSMVPRTLP